MSFSSYQKILDKKIEGILSRQSAYSKNTADLRLQVDASTDRTSVYTSVPTLLPMSLDRRHLISKYRTILRYRDMKRYDISVSTIT